MDKKRLEKGVKQLSDGSWFCDKVYKGVRISFKRKKKFELLEELKLRIAEIDERIENDIVIENTETTFDDLFMIYGQSRHWSDTFFKQQINRFKLHFQMFVGKFVCDVTNADIIEWVSQIYAKRDSRQFQERYANKLLGVMRGMLVIAKEQNMCSNRISLQNIKYFKNLPSSMRSEKLENNYLTKGELSQILTGLEEIDIIKGTKIDGRFFSFVVNVLYYTGCRINEARAIQVKDFIKTIERRKTGNKNIYYVLITKQMEDNRNNIRYHLKSDLDEGRRVYIKKEVYDYVLNFCKIRGFGAETYIFDCFQNNMPLTRKTIAKAMNNCLKMLHERGLVEDSFPMYLSPHGFRNSNTLYLKELGVSIEMAAKMQGHNVSTMLDIYSRIDKNEIGEIFGE